MLNLMFWSGRNAFEIFKIAMQLAERQIEQQKFRQGGYELFELPVEQWKASSRLRDLSKLNYIVTHVTAVKGGFGVSSTARKRWERILGSGRLLRSTGHPSLDEQLEAGGVWFRREGGFEPADGEDTRSIANRLGLWQRYRSSVPYHQIASRNGDIIKNRELSHRTWHANAGNFGAGFAVDCGPDEKLDSWMIETGRQALRVLYTRIIDVSEYAQKHGVRVVPHRAFSSGRRRDTNPEVHREIVIPVVKEIDGLDIDYKMQMDKGRPIPREWDPNALYDSRGRRIKS
jgi:hypothetical protein